MPAPGQSTEKFWAQRMGAFKRGQMHSRVKRTGPVVTKPEQAKAIILSELREAGRKVAPPPGRGAAGAIRRRLRANRAA